MTNRMLPEQLSELVAAAQADWDFWEQIKDREREIHNALVKADELGLGGTDHLDFVISEQSRPLLSDLVEDFARKKLGANHDLFTMTLIMTIRKYARIELELPV